MSITNIFTGLPVAKSVADLFLQREIPPGVDVVLTPTDHAWYNYAVLTGKIPVTPVETYDTSEIKGEGFYELPIEEKSDEISFLDTMGLLVRRPNALYVSPLAEILYGPAGPFQMGITSLANWGKEGPGKPTMAAQKAAIAPTATFMRRYVIPGRMWRAYVARERLPPNIELATTLDAELIAMSKMMGELGLAIGVAKQANAGVQTEPKKANAEVQADAGMPPPSAPPALPAAAGALFTLPPAASSSALSTPPPAAASLVTPPPAAASAGALPNPPPAASSASAGALTTPPPAQAGATPLKINAAS